MQGKPETTETTPADRAQEFRPVEGGGSSGGPAASSLLVTAYVLMWALLFGFLVTTWRRQQALDRRLNDLEKAVAKADPEGDADDP